jgi:glycosyltransferase involved in cell wall biosynthesis
VPRTDILIVSPGNTGGWRTAAEELAGAIARAGAKVQTAAADPAPRVRTFALTDLVEARAARAAAVRGLAEHDPRAIVYCSITAALLWPRPGAIWLDSVAAENRPGRHGIWQRRVERRRLAAAPLVLLWSETALAPLRSSAASETLVLPVPIEGSLSTGPRDLAAVTYAGDPEKRRLSLVLEAWAEARRPGERLVVVGTSLSRPPEGVEAVGTLAPSEFRGLLVRARAFVAAPRREDYGIAALEALAHGCRLVTTPSPGPYPALGLARALDPRLVSEDLAGALRIALDDPLPGYGEQAAQLLEPFRHAVVDRAVADDVLPRLLSR